MGPSSSRYNRAVMQRQFYSDSGLTKPTSVFPHHCDCLHPGRMQSTISQVLHQQLWVSFTQPPPSSFYKPFTKGTTTILVLPSPQKAVRSQPCYDSRSSCKQTWVQMTEPQLPLSSTVGKRKVHKVAQLPCHNLGRAGIAAEVVCAAPQREGVPAITHQEVPNQLRRDADRLWCTFLFFFPSPSQILKGKCWATASMNSYLFSKFIWRQLYQEAKKALPMDCLWIFITGKSPSHSSCSQMTPKLSDLSKTCQAKPFSPYKMAFHCKQFFSLAPCAAGLS